MAGPVGQFKSDHHVIAGVALLTVGVFGLLGSLTGRLASMLAALFDPTALGYPDATGIVTPPIPGKGSPEEDVVQGEVVQGTPSGAPSLPAAGGSTPATIDEIFSTIAELVP